MTLHKALKDVLLNGSEDSRKVLDSRYPLIGALSLYLTGEAYADKSDLYPYLSGIHGVPHSLPLVRAYLDFYGRPSAELVDVLYPFEEDSGLRYYQNPRCIEFVTTLIAVLEEVSKELHDANVRAKPTSLVEALKHVLMDTSHVERRRTFDAERYTILNALIAYRAKGSTPVGLCDWMWQSRVTYPMYTLFRAYRRYMDGDGNYRARQLTYPFNDVPSIHGEPSLSFRERLRAAFDAEKNRLDNPKRMEFVDALITAIKELEGLPT